jgi:hypothetical protein
LLISNTNEKHKSIFNREVFETWNEKVFLEACGIKTDDPTLGEVKEYFKDAKMVECLIYGCYDITSGEIQYHKGDFLAKTEFGYIYIWSEDKGYAKILSYKEPKEEKELVLKSGWYKHKNPYRGNLMVFIDFETKKHYERIVNNWTEMNDFEQMKSYIKKNCREATAEEIKDLGTIIFKKDKFEITKDQILELLESGYSVTRSCLKMWFPDVAKEEKKEIVLEVGDEELWLPVHNYLGFYEVSNMGNVRSLSREVKHSKNPAFTRKVYGRVLSKSLNPQGYYKVVLSMDGIDKTHLVYHLVSEVFLGHTNRSEFCLYRPY